MRCVQVRARVLAVRTALSPRAASVQWHPFDSQSRGCHRSPPLRAEIDEGRVIASESLCHPALHSRPEPRACSGTPLIYDRTPPLLFGGCHRSPPLWAEIDDERASASESLCHPALHSRPEPRACSGTLLTHNRAGAIDRRRSGRRSMRCVQVRARVLAVRTALSPRAASVQWHPFDSQSRGCHRSPPLRAEIDDERASASESLCHPALHSRPERRACSGTLLIYDRTPPLLFGGCHRSPPLWAEIDDGRASASESPCRSHCTLAQSGERAVAPS